MSVLIPVSLRPALLRLSLGCFNDNSANFSPTGLFEAGSIGPLSTSFRCGRSLCSLKHFALLRCGRSRCSLRTNHFDEYSYQLPVIDLVGIRLTANDECADSGLFEADSIGPRFAAAVPFGH